MLVGSRTVHIKCVDSTSPGKLAVEATYDAGNYFEEVEDVAPV